MRGSQREENFQKTSLKARKKFRRLSLIVRVNVVLKRTVVVDKSELYHVSHVKMTTAQVVETSVTVNNNSPIQDYIHLDDQTQPFEMTPGFKPFTR